LFLINVKQRLKDQFLQNWSGRLNDFSRTISNRYISNHRFQPYFNFLSVRKLHVCMSRMRDCSQRLFIETGRWTRHKNTPINERKCIFLWQVRRWISFCSGMYFLQWFEDLRKPSIPNSYVNRSNMQKFIDLMNSENKRIAKNLAKRV
jgi:hypothetical protein